MIYTSIQLDTYFAVNNVGMAYDFPRYFLELPDRDKVSFSNKGMLLFINY